MLHNNIFERIQDTAPYNHISLQEIVWQLRWIVYYSYRFAVCQYWRTFAKSLAKTLDVLASFFQRKWFAANFAQINNKGCTFFDMCDVACVWATCSSIWLRSFCGSPLSWFYSVTSVLSYLLKYKSKMIKYKIVAISAIANYLAHVLHIVSDVNSSLVLPGFCAFPKWKKNALVEQHQHLQ